MSASNRSKTVIKNSHIKNHNSDLPRVNKIADREFLRQGGCESLCILNKVVMQEARVCVEQLHLFCCSLYHVWMAVAH